MSPGQSACVECCGILEREFCPHPLSFDKAICWRTCSMVPQSWWTPRKQPQGCRCSWRRCIRSDPSPKMQAAIPHGGSWQGARVAAHSRPSSHQSVLCWLLPKHRELSSHHHSQQSLLMQRRPALACQVNLEAHGLNAPPKKKHFVS